MRSMYQYLDIKKHEDLALWCSYLLSFYCLFRKKNVFLNHLNQTVRRLCVANTSELMLMRILCISTATSLRRTNLVTMTWLFVSQATRIHVWIWLGTLINSLKSQSWAGLSSLYFCSFKICSLQPIHNKIKITLGSGWSWPSSYRGFVPL